MSDCLSSVDVLACGFRRHLHAAQDQLVHDARRGLHTGFDMVDRGTLVLDFEFVVQDLELDGELTDRGVVEMFHLRIIPETLEQLLRVLHRRRSFCSGKKFSISLHVFLRRSE